MCKVFPADVSDVIIVELYPNAKLPIAQKPPPTCREARYTMQQVQHCNIAQCGGVGSDLASHVYVSIWS